MPQTLSQIMGFSPKVLVALIALGLVATGSIIFNVYFLTTKDKARTEVEGLKEKATSLENELGTLKAGHDQPKNKPKSGGNKLSRRSSISGEEQVPKHGDGPTVLQEQVTELESSTSKLKEELAEIKNQNEKLEINKSELENKLKEISAENKNLKNAGNPADLSLTLTISN